MLSQVLKLVALLLMHEQYAFVVPFLSFFLDNLEPHKRPLSSELHIRSKVTQKGKDCTDYPKTTESCKIPKISCGRNDRKGRKSIDRDSQLCALLSNNRCLEPPAGLLLTDLTAWRSEQSNDKDSGR